MISAGNITFSGSGSRLRWRTAARVATQPILNMLKSTDARIAPVSICFTAGRMPLMPITTDVRFASFRASNTPSAIPVIGGEHGVDLRVLAQEFLHHPFGVGLLVVADPGAEHLDARKLGEG